MTQAATIRMDPAAPAPLAPGIFISYRRTDSEDLTGRIYDRLQRHFAPLFHDQYVFKDANGIPYGVDFRSYLVDIVTKCSMLLAVIGKTWLTVADETGQKRRLDCADDFVRLEIESALERGIPVIPLLVSGAAMPAARDLPKSLEKLAFQNGLKVHQDPIFDDDMYRLIRAVEALLPTRPGAAPAGAVPEPKAGAAASGASPSPSAPAPAIGDLPRFDTDAVQVERQWELVRDTRRPVLDLIGPSYMLDVDYHFLDWNPAFEEIVAKPLKLVRGQHAGNFIGALENCAQVVERAQVRFGNGQAPLVDIEPLFFNSPAYGEIKFQKVATQIANDHGLIAAWCVNLNILGAKKAKALWADLARKLTETVNWSKYAESYDKLLLHFDEYNALLDLVVSKAGDAQVCADLGAGTGNGALKLLKQNHMRRVYAVESNDAMLEMLKRKIEESDRRTKTNYVDRLSIVKSDLRRLGVFGDGYFDAAILINVLYAIEEREQVLRGIYRIIKPGGVLVLSTSHSGTDVKKLFTRMRKRLEERNLFEKLKENFENALSRHETMKSLILRDDLKAIKQYVENAGFEITEWEENQYVDAVVVVKAIRH